MSTRCLVRGCSRPGWATQDGLCTPCYLQARAPNDRRTGKPERRWVRFWLPSTIRKLEHELACERETVEDLRRALTEAKNKAPI